jgi:hypothetical protein
MGKTLPEKIISFYRGLEFSDLLPDGVTVMNPYRSEDVISILSLFSRKYYAESVPRTMILGINPGRFGAGVTGITFTDPVRLQSSCGIGNTFPKRQELSSVFIYEMIERMGGPDRFYSGFFLSAVCPLGFLKNNLNMNYYDDRVLEKAVTPFIVETLKQQLRFGINRDRVICLGEGKNFQYLEKRNREHGFFHEVIPLAHPRFIMQYRLKKKEEYLNSYAWALGH